MICNIEIHFIAHAMTLNMCVCMNVCLCVWMQKHGYDMFGMCRTVCVMKQRERLLNKYVHSIKYD